VVIYTSQGKKGVGEEICNIRHIVPEDLTEQLATHDQSLLNIHQDQLEYMVYKYADSLFIFNWILTYIEIYRKFNTIARIANS